MPPKSRIWRCGDLVAGMVREARVAAPGPPSSWLAQEVGDGDARSAVALHAEVQRLRRAEQQEAVHRPGRRADALDLEAELARPPVVVVSTAPPTTSEWPPRYFVVEWSTRSAPSASGCWRYGLANVLSTATSAPRAWATSASAAMSKTRSSGFVGVSTQTSVVASRRWPRRAASRSVRSTKVNATPNGSWTCGQEPVGAAVEVVRRDDVVAGPEAPGGWRRCAATPEANAMPCGRAFERRRGCCSSAVRVGLATRA